ncbi:MAG: ATP-binding cassette domain-containing protein [Vicinamibacterales bacterium]
MAVFELDFSLAQGTFSVEIAERSDARALALFGPSGSGKTTIAEAIAGLRTPGAGTIAIAGRVLFSRAHRVNVPARERRVGYVPQDVLLFPHLNVRRNVLYGAARGHADLDRVVDLLELGDLMGRRVTSLSGGERQRVALARALVSGPDVLLLDEPMAAVDLPRRRRILEALVRVRNELRVPLVYVAHSPEEVSRIADRVLVLADGRIAAAGEPSVVLADA